MMLSEPWARDPGPEGESRLPQLEILPVLLRFWKMILATTVLAALAVFGLSYLQSTRYQATAQMILSDPRNAGVFRDQTQIVIDPQRYVRNQAALATSTPALLRRSELIGGRLSAGQLDDLVSARGLAGPRPGHHHRLGCHARRGQGDRRRRRPGLPGPRPGRSAGQRRRLHRRIGWGPGRAPGSDRRARGGHRRRRRHRRPAGRTRRRRRRGGQPELPGPRRSR